VTRTGVGGGPPNYPFMVQLWSGFIFMFGCMFWETGADLRRKLPLLKYNWIEKSLTALAVIVGYVSGDAPARLLILIGVTNILFIPIVLWYDLRLRRAGLVAADILLPQILKAKADAASRREDPAK